MAAAIKHQKPDGTTFRDRSPRENRQLYESFVNQGSEHAKRQASLDYVKALHEDLGLVDSNGRQIKDKHGMPCLAESRVSVQDSDLLTVTEAIVGQHWREELGASRPSYRTYESAIGSAIAPGTFINVSAWSTAVSGLLQAATLEGYQSAEVEICDQFPTKPMQIYEGDKMIDVIGPAQPAKEFGVGEPHPSTEMNELWVQNAPLKKYGGKITITRETSHSDITGGKVLSEARRGGETIRLREEYLAMDVLTGRVNNFKMGTTSTSLTAYNTYGSALAANDIVNPFTDYTSFMTVDNLFSTFLHPVTGLPLNIQPSMVIAPYTIAKYISAFLSADKIKQASVTAAPTAQLPPGSLFPSGVTEINNPFKNMVTKVIASQYLYQKHITATTAAEPGLALSATNANRWYILDPKKAIVRRIGWELSTVDLNPSEFMMADRNLIAGQVFNISVMYQVASPYHMVRCKVA